MQFHNHDRQLISLCEIQNVMQLALVAYGRIAHARNKAEGLRRQYLNVPSALFFSNMK
jgi:hypothetical protein